jgi:hypothetical protein
VSFYEQYVHEYRSVLYLIEQTLSLDKGDPGCDTHERLRLLREDVLASFVHVTERMQTQVRQGKMEVDMVLAAMVRECCDKLAALEQRCSTNGEASDDPEQRRQALVRPADDLFLMACQRALNGAH